MLENVLLNGPQVFDYQWNLSKELDSEALSIPLNEAGRSVTLTLEQVKRGKRLFNASCSTCHTGGVTKTNQNVGLDLTALKGAQPRRDNIEALINYMKDPKSYDGVESLSELHPNVTNADIFPKMRNLTEDDLFAIAGHILLQPKLVSEKWGGGKVYY